MSTNGVRRDSRRKEVNREVHRSSVSSIKMGVHDFDIAFDHLDSLQRGYVTANEVTDFYIWVLADTRDDPTGCINNGDLVQRSIDKVLGKGADKVPKNSFFSVLEEVERRRTCYTEIYWDFLGMDLFGNHRITLHNALLLFQEYHGEHFSLNHWHKFLASRETQDPNVSFDEIRDWLYNVPSEVFKKPTSSDLLWENMHLAELMGDPGQGMEDDYRNFLRDDDLDRKEEEEREGHLKQQAERKLNKWRTHGLEAMLHDEGTVYEDNDDEALGSLDDLSVSVVLDAVEKKYSLMQNKVLMEMAAFLANMDTEKAEIYQQLTRKLKKRMKEQTPMADTHFLELEGSNLTLPMSVLGMLGYLNNIESWKREEFAELRQQLESNGLDEDQVNATLEAKHAELMAGELTSCGAALEQLIKRCNSEKKLILDSLRQYSYAEETKILEQFYWPLLRQLRLLQEEALITPAGLAVGLSERPQTYKPKSYDWDRQRSEKLAELRLEARKGHRPTKRSSAAPDLDSLVERGIVALKARLTEELEHCYYLEREAIIYMLQGHDSATFIHIASSMSPEDRKRRIRTLRRQREEWKKSNDPDPAVNQKLLQEAVGLYFEERRLEMEAKNHNVREEFVRGAVLADVQQRQEVEFRKIILDLHGKTDSELKRAVLLEIEAIKDEHFNSIAYVVLGSVEVSPEEAEYLKAVEGKYKTLRDQVLVFGLMEKMGSTWKSLSKEEKKREIIKQRKEEKQTRGEGNLQTLDTLIGSRSQALASMRSLIGEDKVFVNVPPAPPSTNQPINLLADLTPRHDQEQDSLLSWLHSDEVKQVLSKVRHIQLSRMAAEKFVASSEGDHETALLAVGLLERIGSALSGRSKADHDRQLTLAQKRAALRKKAIMSREKLRSPQDEKLAPAESDEKALQAVLLRAILRRHYKEREIMLGFLQDDGLDELVEAASVMSPDQASKRVQELKAKREALDLDDKENEEEHTFILEEAGAIRTAGKKHALCRTLGRAVLMEEVVAHLLAELQDLQDIELAEAINQLSAMTGQNMLGKIAQEEKAKKNSYCHLVMKIFTRFDGDTNSADFEKLIEEKYATLRLYLRNECLSQQQGKTAWMKMSDKQKNKLLAPLTARETALWNEGNSEDMSACIFPGFHLRPSLPYTSGMGRHQYFDAVLKTESDLVSEDNGVTAEDSGGPETISFLHRRFMAEKNFVKNYVAGSLDFVPSDDDKQVLLSQLRWEIMSLQWAHDFSAAGLITGLAERQNADKAHRLQNDRHRFELFARHVLQTCSRKEVDKSKPQVTKSEDTGKLQEAVMALLHKLHESEWSILAKMLSEPGFTDIQQLASIQTQQQREDKLAELQSLWRNTGSVPEKLKILQEATVIKMECRAVELKAGSRLDGTKTNVEDSLMADLLQVQLCEAQTYLEAFVSESQEDFTADQEMLVKRIAESHVTNIVKIIFEQLESKTDDEEKLKEAVDGKYDALRDQLLIQALINEMGEAEWRRLSEKERQRLLMERKMKERQLRREGKYDEAAALIGEMLNNDDKIRKILGDAKEEQERKLRERLERRRQRLAEGMSEEECDELEQQEIAQEEEEERQRKKNILMYLDHCHDKEKEDLLKRLKELEDERERQRQRQLEMLKLRREQRRLREEGKFDAAAILMGLAEDNDRKSKLSKEEEKKRQQELARQRLEMARLRRLQGDNLVRGESIILSEGDQNESRLGENVLRVMDRRHQKERDFFIKLLDGGSEGEVRDEARVMTDDELKSRLEEVQDLYNIWKDSESSKKEDGEKILTEAAVLCIEAKKRDMQADGEIGSDEDVKVALLADLQEMQDGEAAQMMTLLTDTDDDRKKQLLHLQQQSLEKECHENVANILLTFANEEDIFEEGKKDEDDAEKDGEKKVVKALEKKYDAMRDKLLMEALMKQMGEAEWKRLSELERQKKLMEMKREERRLRKEGKMDELAALLGTFMNDKKEIDRLLGQTQEDQKRRIAERLALRKKLKEERAAVGESVDDETLDELVEEEEKKHNRHNILENLDYQFEEEKAALLASLQGQSDHLQKERERQLAIAKLQREQRRLRQEEKFDSAAMIFAQAKEGSDRRQQNLLNERERQRLLAKERLEAMKKQRAAGKGIDAPAEDIVQDGGQETSSDITDGVVFLQDSILAGLEKHQADERDYLMTWISKIGWDKSTNKTLANLPDHDLKLTLAKLQRDYEAWEKKAAKRIADINLSKLSIKQKEKIQKETVKGRKEQSEMLERVLQHKFELERRSLAGHHKDMTGEAVSDEVSICIIADLQEKQMSHLLSVQDLIRDKNEDQLKEIRNMQRSAHQEGWFKTLASVVFTVSDMLGELHSKEDIEGKLAREFEQQKKELLERGQREAIDVDGMIKELEIQYQNQRKAIHTDLDRQREILKQRLAAKKQAAEEKEFDAAAMASQIFAASKANVAAIKEAKTGERGRQDDLLQQRLQARREARRQALAKANAERPISRESTSSPMGGLSSRQGTSDSLLQVPGLSREKTVVDVQVSDDQKQAMYNQLVKQELRRQQRISAQQSRQEDLLKQKLELRSNKRENEVAALFSLGERQKTILEQSQKDERERQIAQMKERVSRVRESRSRSPAKKSVEKDDKK